MQPGIALACAMWAMTLVSLVLVVLRVFTRVRIVKFVGAEDHMYAWTGAFLLVFTCAIQVAVHYGLGQSFWTLSADDSSNAIFWTYVANTFAITGNAMAKLSMGLFLLRVRPAAVAHRPRCGCWLSLLLAPRPPLSSCSGTDHPGPGQLGRAEDAGHVEYSDTAPECRARPCAHSPRLLGRKYPLRANKLILVLVWSSACDFIFAIFPWLFIWSLRMPRRDKVVLACSMSLGVM